MRITRELPYEHAGTLKQHPCGGMAHSSGSPGGIFTGLEHQRDERRLGLMQCGFEWSHSWWGQLMLLRVWLQPD